MEQKRILSIGAHPDDADTYSGGLLSKLRDAGSVSYTHLDVYKRQSVGSIMALPMIASCTMAHIIAPAGSRRASL